MIGRRLLFVAVLLGAPVLSACEPVFLTGGGAPPPCFVGTFNQIGADVSAAINASVLGQIVSVAPVAGGTLKLVVAGTATSGTWTLSGDQAFTVTSTGGINGTATVTGLTAKGSYTANTTAMTITLSLDSTSLAGTASYAGTPMNLGPFSISQLESLLPAENLLGLNATVHYSCGSGGVSFTIPVHNADGSVGDLVEHFDAG